MTHRVRHCDNRGPAQSACRVLRRWSPGLVVLLLSALFAGVPAVASAQTAASNTIASAGRLSLGAPAAGGGANVDFWKVQLNGGDQVQIDTTNTAPSYWGDRFELYAPGTSDGSFRASPPVSSGRVGNGGPSTITLQAPYTGTFILAVCEDSQGNAPDCRTAVPPAGQSTPGDIANPMNPYTFATTLIASPCSASEQRATSTIAGAPSLSVGNCEAGGGENVDYWKVQLNGGDQVQIDTTNTAPSYWGDRFELYAPGTSDGSFRASPPVSSGRVGNGGPSTITLQAPYTGTFILAVCEDSQGNAPDCRTAVPPAGQSTPGDIANPMNPYTFATTLIASPCSASEQRATSTIAGAPSLSVGNCEAGGGENVDYWKVQLNGGDQVQIDTTNTAPSYWGDRFELYAPGTSDGSFRASPPVSSGRVGNGGPSTITLQAPYTGTFILAVCEDSQGNAPDCRTAVPPAGQSTPGDIANPMNPYTFTTSLATVTTTGTTSTSTATNRTNTTATSTTSTASSHTGSSTAGSGVRGSTATVRLVTFLKCTSVRRTERCSEALVNASSAFAARDKPASTTISLRGHVAARGRSATVKGHLEFIAGGSPRLARGSYVLTWTTKSGIRTLSARVSITIT